MERICLLPLWNFFLTRLVISRVYCGMVTNPDNVQHGVEEQNDRALDSTRKSV